jgi:hypothetical protein
MRMNYGVRGGEREGICGHWRRHFLVSNKQKKTSGVAIQHSTSLVNNMERKFEALCHVRCLSSRNPFESDNEVLVTIFGDSREQHLLILRRGSQEGRKHKDRDSGAWT